MSLIWYTVTFIHHIYSLMKSERKMRSIKFLQFKMIHVFICCTLSWLVGMFRYISSMVAKKRDPISRKAGPKPGPYFNYCYWIAIIVGNVMRNLSKWKHQSRFPLFPVSYVYSNIGMYKSSLRDMFYAKWYGYDTNCINCTDHHRTSMPAFCSTKTKRWKIVASNAQHSTQIAYMMTKLFNLHCKSFFMN